MLVAWCTGENLNRESLVEKGGLSISALYGLPLLFSPLEPGEGSHGEFAKFLEFFTMSISSHVLEMWGPEEYTWP